jgi:hypothetical protein
VQTIGVRMHGVSLTLEVDHPPLAAYAVEHLHGLVGPPAATPDLRVRCSWSRAPWDPKVNPFETDRVLNVIGKRMLGDAEELIWLDTSRKKGLQLRFQLAPGRLVFDVSYRFDPKDDKRDAPHYEYKSYFSLMSYMVYYPLFWHLQQVRGWTPLHASALAAGERGLVVAGVGGVGKTTTCVALIQHAGMDLLSENLVFTDGEAIYPCPEPIRLDANSRAILGEDFDGLVPVTFPDGLKDKELFHLAGRTRATRVDASVVLLPVFSRRRHVRPIPPAVAAERIIAMNRLTMELDDYGWWAAAPNLIWPTPRPAAESYEVLHALTRRARCFELGIDRSAGIPALVEDIVGTLGAGGDGRESGAPAPLA